MPPEAPTLILLRPFVHDVTGNAQTARRLASIFSNLGYLVQVHAPEDIPTGEASKWLLERSPRLCVVLHVTKGAAILESGPYPFPVLVVFGGTDVNIDALADPLAFARRVSQATAVVAFAPSLLESATKIMGGEWRSRVEVIPQGLYLPPLAPAEPPSISRSAGPVGLTGDSESPPIADLAVPPVIGAEQTGAPYLLLVAGLRPVKDVLFLVDAMAALWATAETGGGDGGEPQATMASSGEITWGGLRQPPPELRIIGPVLDSAYHREVVSRIEGVRGVRLLPPVARDVLLDLMRGAVGVVNSSVSEGQSCALAEALGLGVPVLARDIPGNRTLLDLVAQSALRGSYEHSSAIPACGQREGAAPEWVIHQTGVLFSTPGGFAEALKHLVGTPRTDNPESEAESELARSGKMARRGIQELSNQEQHLWGGLLGELESQWPRPASALGR